MLFSSTGVTNNLLQLTKSEILRRLEACPEARRKYRLLRMIF
jgi:hypothetical protein